MRICWVKLNGWPDAFNERVDAILENVDEIIIIKPKNRDPTIEPSNHFDSVDTIDLWPSREPVLRPRFLILLYPIWIIQAILFYFLHSIRSESCDVFHAIDYPFSAIVTRYITLLNNKPRVSSVRGLQLPRYRSNQSSSIMSYLLSNVFRRAAGHSLRQSDYIITKSTYQQKYLRENFGIEETPMASIPTGVDYQKFFPSDYPKTRNLLSTIFKNETPDKPIVLHLGQLIPEKGVDTLIKNLSSKKTKDVHFLFVGEFATTEFKSEIEREIVSNDCGDIVTIHPEYIPFESVPQLLSEVDAVCLLSESNVEGVPRVLQEACVMNTPIVASDVNGIREPFMNKKGCFLIPRDDAEEFNLAITNALTTKPNREDFRDQFDMIHNYERIAEIYADLSASNKLISSM